MKQGFKLTGSHVFILGAGFSRAIDGYMPDTNKLGQDAIEYAGLTADPSVPRLPFGEAFNFEAWLSLIAVEQPHLTEAENLHNRELFAALREAIHYVLSSTQSTTLLRTMPMWLEHLVTLLHFERATVVTFNYDTLVEVAVDTLNFRGRRTDSRMSSRDVLNNQPAPPQPDDWYRNPSFRLLKLHGSLDWWAVPDDSSGMSLSREPVRSIYTMPQSFTAEERGLSLPGREPFIVPPSTAKASYYRYPMTRELWRNAYQALRAAERVSLIGYSLPLADSGMVGLVESALRGRRVQIDIVNPMPGPIHERLEVFGHFDIQDYASSNCVSDFTHTLLEQRSRDITASIASLEKKRVPNDPMVVLSPDQRSRNTGSAVSSIVRDGEDIILIPVRSDVPIPTALARPSDATGRPADDELIRYHSLIDEAAGGGRIMVRRDGADQNVVSVDRLLSEIGLSPAWVSFDSVRM